MRRSLIIAAVAALSLTPVAAMAGTKAATSVATIKPAAAASTVKAAVTASTSSLILGGSAASAARRLPIGNLVSNILQRTNALVSNILARVFNISRGS